MSVYRVEAAKASCGVSGCACRDRERRYPSDLTDEQWQVLEPEARAVMAELRKSPAGAPMKHDLRAVLDAIGYLTRYGIEWRALPVDFPPWEAVYAFFQRWSERGLPHRLADRLRGRIRIACGRAELPTAAVIDAQTVRGADTVTAGSAGYDAGKKTKGRKRNIVTDCLGLVLMVTVTTAGMQDRDTAHRLTSRCPDESCCRRPDAALAQRGDDKAWPSARLNSSLLAAMPTGTFTGVDRAAVYEFLEAHAPEAGA